MKKKWWFLSAAALVVLAGGAAALLLENLETPEGKFITERLLGQTPPPNRIYRGRRALAADRTDVYDIVTPGGRPAAERLALVHGLPNSLTENDRELLYDHIRRGPGGNVENAIKNDLMNRLRNQQALPPELTGRLLELYRDRSLDRAVRIYALQHLRPQYELTWEPEIREAFQEALLEADTEIAGGALLALRYLGEEYPGRIELEPVGRRASELATNPAANELTRITALQVAAQLKNTGCVEAARSLAVGEHTPLMLRISALAALGELGDASDLECLRLAAASPVAALHPAARSGLRKLEQRKVR